MPATASRALDQLPKAHLHAHLDGSYPVDAVRHLAARRGVPFDVPDSFSDVWDFFAAYGTVPALVETLDDLDLLCRSLVWQEARDGVLYFEPAIEPQLYAPRLGTLHEVLTCMVRALVETGLEAGVEVGGLLTINTDQDLEIAADLARLAAQFAGSGVNAFGTACFDEAAGLVRFIDAVAIARAAGLPIVCHAGQTGGPESVIEAMDVLGAERISHGFRAAESDQVMRRLAAAGVVCDVCPVSNVALGVVDSLDSHPVRTLIAAGVQVTLNADDQLWFQAGVTDQYRIARELWGLDDTQLTAIAATGMQVAGVSRSTRARFQLYLDRWLLAAPSTNGEVPSR